jgi:aspartate 1-decarboxylase
MYRCMLKSKIHRVVLTDADLNYVGSITIDRDLLEAADILPFEKVQVVNNNNGARFETYAIEGEAGSGCVCLNGAAARLGQPGDILIILSYVQLDDQEARQHKPQVVFVDENNKIAQ